MEQPSSFVVLDDERQIQARRYARISRRLMLVDLVLGGLYMAVWLISSLNIILRDWVAGLTGSAFLQLLLCSVVFGLPYFIIDLPLSFYSGYVLPHRFDQSTQTLKNWIGDQLKGLGLTSILGMGVLQIVYWLLRVSPDLWWLYAGGVMLFFSVILSTLAPVIIMPIFYKFTPLDDEELVRRLKNLGERVGTKIEGVYRFDMSTRTKSANAAVMGLGSTRRIVLGDTLIEQFTHDEIETVLAHELAHIHHRDMPLLILSGSVITLGSFWIAHLIMRTAIDPLQLSGPADPAGLPVFGLIIGLVSLITMPLSNGFSRWRERMADSFALKTTGKPLAFADAMTRLANQNLGEADPERWVVLLLYSHPPISERVAKARAAAGS